MVLDLTAKVAKVYAKDAKVFQNCMQTFNALLLCVPLRKKMIMKKIAIIGVGGVGGYVGGKLTARFADSGDAEIVLVARGENEKAIRENGLKIISTKGEETVHPKLASIEDIKNSDLLILCTKEYDLETTIESIKNHIGENTAILSLLNGVDTKERIERILPEAEIWQGCIYIVSRLSAPGIVRETGNICLIYFGNENTPTEKQKRVETIFREAGIDANLTEDIDAKMWEKFVFISSLAAVTSFLNKSIGGILENENDKNLFDELANEVKQVAKAQKVNISEEAIRQKFDRLGLLPFEATSSMHTDFSSGNRAEIESLVGYVVREAKEYGISVPVYEKVYDGLSKKLAGEKSV
jgi:2-dehydropantoate 2-reductase